MIIDLNDNNEYIIIDKLDYENNISDKLSIFIYNKNNNTFKEIKEEYIYNNIKDKLLNGLEQTNNSKDLKKLKLI